MPRIVGLEPSENEGRLLNVPAWTVSGGRLVVPLAIVTHAPEDTLVGLLDVPHPVWKVIRAVEVDPVML